MTSQGNPRDYQPIPQAATLETATYRLQRDYWLKRGLSFAAACELATAGVSGNSRSYEAAKRKHGVSR